MNKDLDLLYSALLLSLGQEYEHYQELSELVQEETTLLKQCTPEEVLGFNARKEQLLLSLQVATEMRVSATRRIASHLHLDEPVSMTKLMASAKDQTRQNLMDYREKIADLVRETEKRNAHNKDLINASLGHINNTLNYIHMLSASSSNYDRRGQVKAGNLHGRLISQAG